LVRIGLKEPILNRLSTRERNLLRNRNDENEKKDGNSHERFKDFQRSGAGTNAAGGNKWIGGNQ
jgi:hypothetical protein